MKKRQYHSSRPQYGTQDQCIEGIGLYPDENVIHFSNTEFPFNAENLTDTDLPFGFVTRPFILNSAWCLQADPTTTMSLAKDIARCIACGGYLNPLCDASTNRWTCSLCGKRNPINKTQLRYRQGDGRMLPEIKDNLAEFKMPLDSQHSDVFSMSARERPLIHVFLVQENMQMDNLQATVEALSSALGSLHPDIHVLLVTYSDRIGLYSVSKSGACAVQHAYFLGPEEQNDGDGAEAAASASGGISVPLTEILNFWDASCRIGDCRDAFTDAVQAVFDLALSNPRDAAGNASLGSVLLAVYNWLVGSSPAKVQHHPHRPAKGGAFNFGQFWQAFSNDTTGHTCKTEGIADRCSGIIMHVFTDTPQPAPAQSLLPASQLYSIDSLSKQFAAVDVSIQLWGVCTFDSHELGLVHVLPLVQRTGGQVHRMVLGVYRDQSQAMYCEELARALCTRYATKCLFKIRMTSVLEGSAVTGAYWEDQGDEGLLRIAAMTPDSSIGCEAAFKNSNNGSLADDEMDDFRRQDRNVVVQVAFSFETLVEDVLMATATDDNAEQEQGNSQKEIQGHTSNPLPQCHLDYIKQSLKTLGLPAVDDGMLREVLQEPNNINVAKKSAQRRTQLCKAKGYLPYSFMKTLGVVRILRVITFGVAATSRLSSFVQSSDYSTVSDLIMRNVFQRTLACGGAVDNKIPVAAADGKEVARIPSIINAHGRCGERDILNWIGRAIFVIYHMKYVLYGPQATELKTAMEGEQGMETKKALLREVMSTSGVNNLVVLLCSALIKTVSWGADHQSAVLSDKAALFMFTTLTRSPPIIEQLLFPTFHAINDDGTVVNGLLSLAREAMVSSGAKSFLLDAGPELVLYKQIDMSARSVDANILSSEPLILTNVQMAEQRNAIMSGVLGYVIRRLSQHPLVCESFKAEAGTSTAAYLAPYLFLDSGTTAVSYTELVEFVLEITAVLM